MGNTLQAPCTTGGRLLKLPIPCLDPCPISQCTEGILPHRVSVGTAVPVAQATNLSVTECYDLLQTPWPQSISF